MYYIVASYNRRHLELKKNNIIFPSGQLLASSIKYESEEKGGALSAMKGEFSKHYDSIGIGESLDTRTTLEF